MPRPVPDPALTPQGCVFSPADGTRLPCPGRGRVEYHERSSGLRLRVTATGARSWVMCFWSPVAKVQRRLKLGDRRAARALPLRSHRAEADRALRRAAQVLNGSAQ